MCWCTAQCKMLPFCVETITKESCNFVLAHLKKKKKKKERFHHSWKHNVVTRAFKITDSERFLYYHILRVCGIPTYRFYWLIFINVHPCQQFYQHSDNIMHFRNIVHAQCNVSHMLVLNMAADGTVSVVLVCKPREWSPTWDFFGLKPTLRQEWWSRLQIVLFVRLVARPFHTDWE